MKVHLLASVSLDGFISKGETDDLAWSGQADKKWFVEKTKASGVTIMGNNTHKKMHGVLEERLNIVYSKSPQNESPQEGLQFTNENPVLLLQELEKAGYSEVCVIGGSQINSLFLKTHMVTDLWLTFCPITLGGTVPLFAPPVPEDRFQLESNTLLDSSTMLAHYMYNS